jgi:hypothetical protein
MGWATGIAGCDGTTATAIGAPASVDAGRAGAMPTATGAAASVANGGNGATISAAGATGFETAGGSDATTSATDRGTAGTRAAGATVAFANGCTAVAGGTAIGIFERRPMEGFWLAGSGASTPGKAVCSRSAGCAMTAAGVGTAATVWPTGIAGCDGATIAAVGALGTAAGATWRTGLTTSGVTMTGTLESLMVVAAAIGTDATAGPAGFRHPLVRGVEVALAAAFVVGISRRPAEVTEAAGVGKAAAGAAPAVDLVGFGTVTIRWRDCARAGATGTSCPVKSVRLLVVGQKDTGASGWRVEMVG